jgi:hypothetical protein
MTTMARENVTNRPQPLPPKIEHRLAELLRLGEFDQGEVAWCRRTYWDARDDWHTTLINCYDVALARLNTQHRKETA